jgi:DNA-binding transcriptional MerR regulator
VEVKTVKFFNANQVAKLLNISKQTLLRYEQKGIFPKAQRNNVNNWREYTEEDVHQLRNIMGRER